MVGECVIDPGPVRQLKMDGVVIDLGNWIVLMLLPNHFYFSKFVEVDRC